VCGRVSSAAVSFRFRRSISDEARRERSSGREPKDLRILVVMMLGLLVSGHLRFTMILPRASESGENAKQRSKRRLALPDGVRQIACVEFAYRPANCRSQLNICRLDILQHRSCDTVTRPKLMELVRHPLLRGKNKTKFKEQNTTLVRAEFH